MDHAATHEFSLFTRYLLGRSPPAALRDRYVSACAKLGPALGSSKALRLAVRTPFLLPLLDAGCGVLRAQDPLRRRLHLAAAILEAAPDFADDFLPRARPPVAVFLTIGWAGACGVLKALLGAVLLLFLRETPP